MANKIEMIVRHYVKRFLSEALIDFDKLVERKVQEKIDYLSLMQESKSPVEYRTVMEEQVVPQSSSRKRITPEMLGITDETWKNIYDDTLASNNPILGESSYTDEPPADRPELVPESVLRNAGLMKDFSAHMEAMEKRDKRKTGSNEDLDAYNKRREMLNKNIV